MLQGNIEFSKLLNERYFLTAWTAGSGWGGRLQTPKTDIESQGMTGRA
jgi:hypothetical protein